MILILTHIIALVIGVISGMGVTFAVNSHLDVRRKLKEAQAALEAQETAPQPGHRTNYKVVPVYEDSARSEKPDAPRFSGIGPSDIASRELYEREQAQIKSTPRFASPSVLNPSLADVKEAAREATDGRAN